MNLRTRSYPVCQGGRVGVEIVREFGIDMYTPVYLK